MKKITTIFVLGLLFAINTPAQQMKVGGQAGLNVPMGNFGDLVGIGFGAHGLFVYNLQPNLDLTGSIGYYTYGSKSESEYADYSYSDVPFLVGVRYSFPTQSTFMPYVGAEIGLHFQSISWEYNVDLGEYGGFARDNSVSETDFGFHPIVGFRYPVSPSMQLDVNAKFNVVSDANSFGIYAGVLFGI